VIQDIPIEKCEVDSQNPRETFDEDELDALGAAMQAYGQLTPCIGRKLASGRIGLFVGQRRLRAAERIGLPMLRVDVIDVPDEAGALERALVEQTQREDLHPLEEAAAYETLLGSPDLAEAGAVAKLADRFGKSPGYIRGRLQLLKLSPKARKAFGAGEIDLTRAFALARIPSTKVQEQVLGKALDEKAWDTDEPATARQLLRVIQEEHQHDLGKAPFDTADTTLVPAAGNGGSCLGCPDNTATRPELFDDVKAGPLGVCTNGACYRSKVDANYGREAKTAKESGEFAKVLDPGQSAKVFQVYNTGRFGLRHDAGYVDLDEKHYSYQTGREQKWSTVVAEDIKKGAVKPVLAQRPDGTTATLLPSKAAHAIADRVEKVGKHSPAMSPAEKKKRQEEKRENDLLRSVAGAAVRECVKAAASKGEAAILQIAITQAHLYDLDEDLAGIIGVKDGNELQDKAAKLTVAQLRQGIVASALQGSDMLTGGEIRGELKATCKLLGVDLKKVEKDVRRAADLAAVGASADPEATAAAAAKAKAKPKKKGKR